MKKCNKCGIEIRQSNKSGFCKKCFYWPRCKNCGQIISSNGLHNCVSVDLKGIRHCKVCNVELKNTGCERWSKICSKCNKKKWRETERQQRKELIANFGGKCTNCGYKKCRAALHFHHVDNSEKYEWRKNGGSSIREIKSHPERFCLLCANCHIEIHQPKFID